MAKAHKAKLDNLAKSDQWNEFFEEFQNESERGAVLVATAFLDEHLRQLLVAFMVADEVAVAELLDSGENSPLASFSSRIRAAYCLGLITREMYDDLHTIRRIRNRFAHDLQGLTFQDQQIIQLCNNLKHAKKSNAIAKYATTPNSQFLIAVTQIATWIRLFALGIREDKRQVQPDIPVTQEITAD